METAERPRTAFEAVRARGRRSLRILKYRANSDYNFLRSQSEPNCDSVNRPDEDSLESKFPLCDVRSEKARVGPRRETRCDRAEAEMSKRRELGRRIASAPAF